MTYRCRRSYLSKCMSSLIPSRAAKFPWWICAPATDMFSQPVPKSRKPVVVTCKTTKDNTFNRKFVSMSIRGKNWNRATPGGYSNTYAKLCSLINRNLLKAQAAFGTFSWFCFGSSEKYFLYCLFLTLGFSWFSSCIHVFYRRFLKKHQITILVNNFKISEIPEV